MSTNKDDDFDFDDSQLDENVDLNKIDNQFLQKMQAQSDSATCDASSSSTTFWFLVILLIIFVLLTVMAVICIVKGRQRRQQYVVVGYRNP